MASTPPPSSGGLKYAALGLLLLLSAVCLLFVLFPAGEPEATNDAPDAGAAVERSTSLGPETFEIVEDVILDAGQADAGQAQAEGPTKTRTYGPRGSCNGNLDQSAITSVIAANRRQVRNCYERALKQNSMLQGRVSVQLQIAPNGSVQSANVGGNLTPQVNQCVRSLARAWTFPAPSGGCVAVNVPFSFSPRE